MTRPARLGWIWLVMRADLIGQTRVGPSDKTCRLAKEINACVVPRREP